MGIMLIVSLVWVRLINTWMMKELGPNVSHTTNELSQSYYKQYVI